MSSFRLSHTWHSGQKRLSLTWRSQHSSRLREVSRSMFWQAHSQCTVRSPWKLLAFNTGLTLIMKRKPTTCLAACLAITLSPKPFSTVGLGCRHSVAPPLRKKLSGVSWNGPTAAERSRYAESLKSCRKWPSKRLSSRAGAKQTRCRLSSSKRSASQIASNVRATFGAFVVS